MSLVAIGLNAMLALLLMVAVGVGLKLNARLKALKESQAGFIKAVHELDAAAARAEAGLAALKAAQDQTHDSLLARIETARGLIGRLEAASHRAAAALPSSPAAVAEPAPKPIRQAAPRLARPGAREIDDDLFEEPRRASPSPLRRMLGR